MFEVRFAKLGKTGPEMARMGDGKTSLRLALVAHRVERNDGQGRVNYEIARAALASGMHVTLLAAYCAEDIASHPQAHLFVSARSLGPPSSGATLRLPKIRRSGSGPLATLSTLCRQTAPLPGIPATSSPSISCTAPGCAVGSIPSRVRYVRMPCTNTHSPCSIADGRGALCSPRGTS